MLTEADFTNLTDNGDNDGFDLEVPGTKDGQPGHYIASRSGPGKPVKFRFKLQTADGCKATESKRELNPGEVPAFIKPMAKFAGLAKFNGVSVD